MNDTNQATSTQIVLLGTGTPNAEPDRAGPSVAIVVGNQAYLVDCGPGVVRRAAAAHQNGIKALSPPNLTTAFITHLHSDHTVGYPDLILTPWTLGRETPLRVFGPPGLQSMTDHLLAAYQADIQERLDGLEPANSGGHRVEVSEISAGTIYKDSRITVEAVPADHGTWASFGYKFTTPDGLIAVSGDTAPHPEMAEMFIGCDILVHEVYSSTGFAGRSTDWQAYHARVHTSTLELAQLANQIEPKLVVLYHQLYWGQSDEDLLREIRSGYSGRVVSGHDLDVFDLQNLRT